MYIDKKFFMSVVPDAQWIGPDLPKNCHIVVDSRALNPGDLFVACKGMQHDGHDFIHDVLVRGARGIIAQRLPAGLTLSEHISYIMVPDSLHAVIEVARAWRKQLRVPLVGITGSVGKTSTKELLGEMVKAAGLF